MGKPKGSKNRKAAKAPAISESVHDAWNPHRDSGSAAEEQASPVDNVFSDLPWLPTSEDSQAAVSDRHLDPLTAIRSPADSTDMQFSAPQGCPTLLEFENPDDDNIERAEMVPSMRTRGPQNQPGRPFALGTGFGDDDDESSRLDAFNSLAAVCVGLPLTPDCSQAREGESISSHIDDFAALFSPPPSTHVPTPWPTCACLQEQAAHLSNLRAVEQRQPSVQLDTILHCSTLTQQSSEKLLQCAACKTDFQVLLITVMVFQTVLRWAEALCSSDGTLYAKLDVRMGHYRVSGVEASLIQDLLVSRVFGKSKQVLDLLRARVEQTSSLNESSEGPPQRITTGTEYLQHSCQTLIRTLVRISKRLHLSASPSGFDRRGA